MPIPATASRIVLLHLTFAVLLLGGVPASAEFAPEDATWYYQGLDGMPGTPAVDEHFGAAMGIGDFDGDGDPDLAIASPQEVVSAVVGTGTVTVVYGGGAGLDFADVQILAVEDFAIGNAQLDDGFGAALAVGDFDHDLRDDLAIGIPWRSHLAVPGAFATGMVLVVYGSPSGLDVTRHQLLIPGVDDLIGHAADNDRFGWRLVAADFNGDLADDLAIAAPLKNGSADEAGSVTVIYGSDPDGLLPLGGPVASQVFDQTVVSGEVEAEGERFGGALAAGDLNDDGFDDLVVGTPYDEVLGAPGAGSVTILRGSATGLGTLKPFLISEAGPATGSFAANDYYGIALAVGDLDCDLIDDLVVGVSGQDVSVTRGAGGTAENAGAVTLYHGSGTGLDATAGIQFDRGDADGSLTPWDLFGSGLVAADFTGDGCDDLAVGVPGADPEGVEGAGMVLVLAGRSDGPPVYSQALGQQSPFPGSPEPGDHLGSVLVAGDIDGDGIADLAAGIPRDSSLGHAEAGQINLFHAPSVIFADGFESGDTTAWN